jgi:hypothetical protein
MVAAIRMSGLLLAARPGSQGGPWHGASARSARLSSRSAAAEGCAALARGLRHNRCNRTTKTKGNKRKQNCFHLLSFVFIYFSESRLFNRLRPKNQKLTALSHLPPRLQRKIRKHAHPSRLRDPEADSLFPIIKNK